MSTWLVAGGVTIVREGVIVIGTEIATKNPDVTSVMIGRFYNNVNNYITKAGNSFTYFNLGRSYKILNKIGLANPMNQRFIVNQISKAKNFYVYGAPAKTSTNLLMEIQMIRNSGIYTEFSNSISYWREFLIR